MKNQTLYIFGAIIAVSLVLIYFYGISRTRAEGFNDPGTNSFTMYYVDWCHHCKNAKPEFEKLKSESPLQINGKQVEISMINPENDPAAAKGKPVKGYPTILLQKASGETVEYQGERAYAPFKDFLKENV